MVQSVKRAVRLLDALSRARKPLSLGELSREAQVPSSTARRLLLTMIADGLVKQTEEDRTYTVGSRIYEMAFRVLAGMDIRTQAATVLDQLNEETGLTVHLAILDEGEVVYIDKREAREPVRMYSAVGKRAPVHCTALGKAILAFLEVGEQERIIQTKGLAHYTRNTITSPGALQHDLRLTRKRGYSLDNAEQQDNIHCVGAPVRDHSGRVVASISLTGTSLSRGIKKTDKLGALLIRAAMDISVRLGYSDIVLP